MSMGVQIALGVGAWIGVSTVLGLLFCKFVDHVHKVEMLPDPSIEPSAYLRPCPKPKRVTFERNPDGFILAASVGHPIGALLPLFLSIWALGMLLFVGAMIYFALSTEPFRVVLSLILLLVVVTIAFELFPVALLAFHGRVEIVVKGNDGRLFIGTGSIGRTSTFRWNEIVRVYVSRPHRFSRGYGIGVVLDGRNVLKFGTWPMNIQTRDYIVHVLATMLVARRDNLPPGIKTN
jgi:hypothetical protein